MEKALNNLNKLIENGYVVSFSKPGEAVLMKISNHAMGLEEYLPLNPNEIHTELENAVRVFINNGRER